MRVPLLSVIMITYNQEKYIQKAIEGIFSQKTNFLIELIISNDCSPDNSDKLIKKIIARAPNNIVVNYTCHKQNKGMMSNFIWALQQAKGKYIALCEGDDYWTDENKLHLQVNFLENNPDYVLCHHNYFIERNNKIISESYAEGYFKNQPRTIDDLAKSNFIQSLTIVFRTKYLEFPTWLQDAIIGDWPVFISIAKHGKMKYFDERMAVYREGVGVWHLLQKNTPKMIDLLENIYNSLIGYSNAQQIIFRKRNKMLKGYLLSKKIKDIIPNKYYKELTIREKIVLLLRKFKIINSNLYN